MVHLLSALMFVLLLNTVECRTKPAVHYTEEESADESHKWAYVDVRENAHLFYWLYYSSHPDGYESRPWIIWLQGGPWGSSCGFGNFDTIGPLDVNREPRNTTWVKQANVLFIDSPVGTGYSYVDDKSAFNKEVEHMIDDLMELLRVFLKRNPIFKTFPLHIFGESYGGKVAAYLSRRLYDAIQNKQIKVKLIGFVLGNAWISPMDYILNYADLALSVSLVDEHGWEMIHREALRSEDFLKKENWSAALHYNYQSITKTMVYSNWVKIYDISSFYAGSGPPYPLYHLMQRLKESKQRIPENRAWSGQFHDLDEYIAQHYLKPSVHIVDDLLNTTDLQVIIYQGQLNIIANTKGVMQWVQKLTWSNLTNYNLAERKALINPVDNQIEGYVKAYGKFKFYTILGAGHMVAQAKGDAAYRMLERILENVDQ